MSADQGYGTPAGVRWPRRDLQPGSFLGRDRLYPGSLDRCDDGWGGHLVRFRDVDRHGRQRRSQARTGVGGSDAQYGLVEMARRRKLEWPR